MLNANQRECSRNPEDFVTCAQVLKENRGVRAKARYRRHRPIAKVLKKNSSDKVGFRTCKHSSKQ